MKERTSAPPREGAGWVGSIGNNVRMDVFLCHLQDSNIDQQALNRLGVFDAAPGLERVEANTIEVTFIFQPLHALFLVFRPAVAKHKVQDSHATTHIFF